MKKVFLVLSIISIAISCNREALNNVGEINEVSTPSISAMVSPEYQAVDHFVSKKDVSGILSQSFLKKAPTEVTPIEEGGDVVMYLARFDEGWALVAADDRAENQILAFDEEGELEPNNIENPEFLFWLETTKAQMSALRKTEDIKRAEQSEAKTKSGEEDYYWIRWHIRDVETITQDHVAHLLNTKWGQEEPWNIRCPFLAGDSGDRRLTGCVAVATAQILYYLRMSKNFSIGLYHQISAGFSDAYQHVYDINGTYLYSIPYKYISSMTRSGYTSPSTRWAAMAKEEDEEITTYVGDLMIDIGEHVDMKYKYWIDNNYEGHLSSETGHLSGAYSYYDVLCDSTGYSYPIVKSSIDDGYPVMVGANDGSSGHAWVIDGYHDYRTTTDAIYMWYRASADSLSYYDYTVCYTEAQKQQFIPDVNEGDIEHEYTYSAQQYLLMNWGWDGQDNNVKCWFSNGNWPTTNNDYPYNPVIIYNFRQEDE